MKVIFLGVGEAFDENFPNNSHLIVSEKTNLLLDCGCTTPTQLWKFNNDQSFLDAVYISHRHADHYFGIPALLYRMREEERKKPLTIICQDNKIIKDIIDYGYKGLYSKLGFDINFIEVEESQTIQFNDLKLLFALTTHSTSNFAIKIDDGKKSLCYSGDGGFNEKTEELYKNSDIVIHEAYFYDEKKIGHGCIIDLIKMAERSNVKCLALTHIHRDLRKELKKKKISSKKVKIIIPKPFDKFKV